jgi:hypothetical protein
MRTARFGLAAAACVLLGCGGSDKAAILGPAPARDVVLNETDFGCTLAWDKVGDVRITNKAGHLAEALAVARSPTGGTFPVGTLIQLVPFEASVKRAPGFSAQSHDWEFFALMPTAAGTQIVSRGTTDVINQFGGNCLTCHAKAKPQWDMFCGTGHGCDPLPLTSALIDQLQHSDPRCMTPGPSR